MSQSEVNSVDFLLALQLWQGGVQEHAYVVDIPSYPPASFVQSIDCPALPQKEYDGLLVPVSAAIDPSDCRFLRLVCAHGRSCSAKVTYLTASCTSDAVPCDPGSATITSEERILMWLRLFTDVPSVPDTGRWVKIGTST